MSNKLLVLVEKLAVLETFYVTRRTLAGSTEVFLPPSRPSVAVGARFGRSGCENLAPALPASEDTTGQERGIAAPRLTPQLASSVTSPPPRYGMCDEALRDCPVIPLVLPESLKVSPALTRNHQSDQHVAGALPSGELCGSLFALSFLP